MRRARLPRPAALIAGIALAISAALLAAAPPGLHAQAVVTGTVVSSEDGAPVSDAAVTLETWDGAPVAEARSDEDGRFRIEVERPQTYVISAAARAFSRSELTLIELEEGAEAEVTLEVVPQHRPEPGPALEPVEASPGEIAGRVVDAQTGAPVPGADVVLLAREEEERLAAATSGPGGTFRLRPPEPGRYRIFAEVGAFARTPTLLVDVSPESGLSLTLELISDPVQLEELVAEGREEIYWWQDQRHPDVWDYYERRHFYQRLRIGRFYDGQYLQDWKEIGADEFIRAHTFVGSERCSTIGVYLDGLFVGIYHLGPDLSRDARIENSEVSARVGFYATGELEGVEVYREGHFNPPDLPSGCQKVAVWSRRPHPR